MNLLALTLFFPLLGWLLLAFSRGRFSENTSAVIGVGSIGLAAVSAAWVIAAFLGNPPAGGAYSLTLWQWMSVEGLAPSFTLHLDGLSATMLGVVTGITMMVRMPSSVPDKATPWA